MRTSTEVGIQVGLPCKEKGFAACDMIAWTDLCDQIRHYGAAYSPSLCDQDLPICLEGGTTLQLSSCRRTLQ